MKQEELNEILRLHKLWLAGEEGGVKADLKKANLKGANLYGANLKEADLSDANLEGAYLREADLKWAGLREANLIGANLYKTNIKGADLKGADLKSANLSEASLEGANLSGANIDYACWPLWCGSLDVIVDSKIAAQLVYHVVRACQSATDDADIVAFCNDPVVIRLANRFHRADECGKIEVKDGALTPALANGKASA